MTDQPYWTVAQAHGEVHVQKLLDRDGFETYRPKIRAPQRRSASLFPGYLMVRVVVRWYPIRWCPGVVRLLMNGDRPARLPDSVINEIKAREVRGFVKLPKEPGALEPGQRVRVARGVFEGSTGIYEGMSGSQRDRVLLDALGRVSLPIGSIEALPTLAEL